MTVYGRGILMSKQIVKFRVIYLLCAIMPLHSMVIDKIIGAHTTGLVNLWRDLLIIGLAFFYKKYIWGKCKSFRVHL